MELLSALVHKAAASDDALARLDALAARHTAALRSLTKRLQAGGVTRRRRLGFHHWHVPQADMHLGLGLLQATAALARPRRARPQDARTARDNDAIRAAVAAYDDAVERYIPGGRACAHRSALAVRVSCQHQVPATIPELLSAL